MKIDPWSSTTYQDYTRLRDEFGIEEFSEDLYKDLKNPHKLLRRGVIFGHRGFKKIKEAVINNKPWAILTGLMPSGKMHLGHKMVIDQVIYYQSLGADINIAVADLESFATRGYTLEQTKKYALEEFISNYIALGLKPEKTRIYFQSKNQEVKDLAYLLGNKVNWSQMQATYGFEGSTSMAHIYSPMIQTGDILHVQLKKYGGSRPTLVPVGVDQDPHIRLCRDFSKLKKIPKYKAIYIEDALESDIPKIDEKFVKEEPKFGGYGFFQPSATFHRFMTGLTGDKMSSSKPESAIFLTDTPKEAKKKIMKSKTGGAVSLEEQKKQGGKPDECVVYELFLYHLIDDDKELKKIYADCKSGKQMCGMCKKYAAELMEKMLNEISKKRKKAIENIDEYLS